LTGVKVKATNMESKCVICGKRIPAGLRKVIFDYNPYAYKTCHIHCMLRIIWEGVA